MAAFHFAPTGWFWLLADSQVPFVEQRTLDHSLLRQESNRVGSQRRNPVQAIRPTQFLVNPPTRDHSTIAYKHDPLHAKSAPDLSNLGTQGLGVSGITREYFDCDRAPLRVAQQTVNDLGKTSLA